MLNQFNERAFLIRALVSIFVVQFVTVGYQMFSCHSAIQSSKESEKVTLVCNNAASSLSETGKVALATLLALLVPSASQGSVTALGQSRKRKETPQQDNNEANP